MNKELHNKYLILLLILLGSFFVFKSYYSTSFPITGDEAYHWEWSRHLALGYYDHPPMIAWIMAIIGSIGNIIGGPMLFWTRLPGLLSTIGILILAYLLLVQTTMNKKMGIYGVLFLILTPFFSLGSNLVTTDHSLIFFSGLTIYLLYQALFNNRNKFWYYAGLSLGCAFLSKFISILLFPGLFLFFLLSPEYWYWFKRKEPYLFILIGILLYIPNLVWNAQNNWVTFMFNFYRNNSQLSIMSLLGTIVGQMGMIGMLLFPILIISLIRGVKQGVKLKDRKALFFSLLSLSVLGFFALVGLLGNVGAHWTAIAYLPAVVTFFYVYQDLFDKMHFKKIMWWSLHIGLVLSFIVIIAIHVLLSFNYLLPEEINIAGETIEINHTLFGFFYGWDEVGIHLNELQTEYEEQLFYVTSHYAVSSMLSFNTPGQPLVRLLGQKYITGLNYVYWNNYSDLKGESAIFICKNPEESEILYSTFQNVEKLESLEIYNPAGLNVRTFYFFYAEGFMGKDLTITNNKVMSWFKN